MRSLRALTLLGALTLLAQPSIALALSPTIGAFGPTTGNHAGTNTDLVMYPISAADCSTPIPLTFSGLTSSTTARVIDIWSATSAAAGCQTGTVRANMTSPVCTHVTGVTYPSGPTYTIMVSASQLFGSCTMDARRTFFFFDTTSAGENTMNYATYWTLEISLDVTAPTPAPIIAGTPAGDTTLSVSWNHDRFTDLGIAGKVNVYVDPSGCSGDGGTSTLMPDTAPSGTPIVSVTAGSPIAVPTSSFWTSASYGQSVALAIAVVDTAGNVSHLSNVVCATHVQVSGFWDQYCAAHGMTDTTACANSYRGCSVALPDRRRDPGAWLVGAVAVGLVVVARRRRRNR